MALRKFVVRGKVSRKLSNAIAAAGKEKGRDIAVSMRKSIRCDRFQRGWHNNSGRNEAAR